MRIALAPVVQVTYALGLDSQLPEVINSPAVLVYDPFSI